MTQENPPPQQPIFVPPGHEPPPGYVAYYPAQPGQPVQPVTPKKSNGNATASLIVSGGALALLIFTVGILAPITVIASIVGTVLGHKGKSAADHDPELGQRDEAVAGFWMGIAGIVLAVFAIIALVVLIVVLASVDEVSDSSDFHHPYLGPNYEY